MKKSMKDQQSGCTTCPVPEGVRDDLCRACAVSQLLRGKWKLLLLWLLRDQPLRFSQLQAAIPKVKQGPMTAQLRAMADSGLVDRKSFNEVPPRVEYQLTEKGRSLLGLIKSMDQWGREHLFVSEADHNDHTSP